MSSDPAREQDSIDDLLQAAAESRVEESLLQQRASAFQIIRFRSGGREFAVPIEHVQRTERVPLITPVPRSPEYIRGVTSLRAEVVCVLDLRSFLSDEAGPTPAESTSLLVLGSGKRRIAVLSEGLPDFERISTDEIIAVPASEADIYSGAVERDARLVGLIDPPRLCDLVERRLAHAR